MKFLLIFLFLITSCAQNNIDSDFNFTKDMSLEEFKVKLEEYANKSSYPNIDK